MSDALRPAAAAITFLTRIPLGRLVRVEADDVGRGAWLFPIVGGAVGGVSGLVADVTASWLPALAAGALAVGAAAVLTGAMHLDALGDTADALGASTRERTLEIMRDPAVGAFGATALIVVCVLDAALFGALAETEDAALVGLAAGASGRAVMLPPALAMPYARETGQGLALVGVTVTAVAVALVLGAVLALPAGAPGLWAAGTAALAAVLLSLFARHRFGGVTGDVLGTIGKLAETAALVAAVVAI